jgi:hypothetical protein
MDVWPDDVSVWPGILIVIGIAMAADQIFQTSRISGLGPIILIGLGTFFLLRDFDVIESAFIFPAILIVAGIGLLAGVARRGNADTEAINVPLEGASHARVRVDHGGGELRVGSLPTGSALLCTGSAGGVEQSVNRSGDGVDVSLRQTGGAWTKTWRHDVRLDFNPGVDLELALHTGATDTKLDLSDLLVSSLEIKTGASSTEVWTPRRGQTRASVDAGAASVAFVVPDGVAARISVDTGLASVKIDTRRFPSNSGGYESPDYVSATHRLDLRIKGGLAEFTVS